jgi:cytochrome P450
MSGPGHESRQGSSPAEGEAITGLAWSADDRQFLEDPSDYYRWLRDEEPVHFHETSGSFFLSRFEDVWQATADWQTFSSQSPVSRLRHMASMDPPDHDRLRASVVRHFSPHRIARLEPRIRGICRELLDPLARESSFDLVARFTTLFPSFVINRLMGVPRELDEPMREIALGIGAARDTGMLGRLMDELAELTVRVVEGDPAPAEPGLIQMLQREEGAAGLDREDLRGICSNLVLAGTDTVTNLVGNGVVLLARRPGERERLLREPGLIRRAVEEMLRFESPVQSLARRVTRDVTLHGVTLPEGAEVRLQWGAANRDEREFDHPDAFDVGREIRRHLALGHGRHFCLGAHLARLEARVALEELLQRWPGLGVDESRLERLPSLWVRAWSQILVVADSDAA